MGINQIRKTIIAVPARVESSRLPKKVLEDINGKPMLIRVLEQCKKVCDGDPTCNAIAHGKYCITYKNCNILF